MNYDEDENFDEELYDVIADEFDDDISIDNRLNKKAILEIYRAFNEERKKPHREERAKYTEGLDNYWHMSDDERTWCDMVEEEEEQKNIYRMLIYNVSNDKKMLYDLAKNDDILVKVFVALQNITDETFKMLLQVDNYWVRWALAKNKHLNSEQISLLLKRTGNLDLLGKIAINCKLSSEDINYLFNLVSSKLNGKNLAYNPYYRNDVYQILFGIASQSDTSSEILQSITDYIKSLYVDALEVYKDHDESCPIRTAHSYFRCDTSYIAAKITIHKNASAKTIDDIVKFNVETNTAIISNVLQNGNTSIETLNYCEKNSSRIACGIYREEIANAIKNHPDYKAPIRLERKK